MIWEITASISLKSGGEGDYHIIPLTLEMDGSKPFSIDQLVESVRKEVVKRGKQFDHIVYFKVAEKKTPVSSISRETDLRPAPMSAGKR
jgi:hypothetical protein